MHLRQLPPPPCIPRLANFRRANSRYAPAAAFFLQHACLAVPEIQPVAQRIPGSTHRQSPHGAKAPRTLHIPSNPCASSSLRSLSKRTSPPASLDFFNGRVGSPKLLWNAVRFAASLCWFSRSTRQHSSVVASVRCRTLGKIHHPVSSPTHLPSRSGCPCPLLKGLGRLVTSIPYWESLKVIAFDKTTVNRNFSSGYVLAYIPR